MDELKKALAMEAATKKLVASYELGTEGRRNARRFMLAVAELSVLQAARLHDIIKGETE